MTPADRLRALAAELAWRTDMTTAPKNRTIVATLHEHGVEHHNWLELGGWVWPNPLAWRPLSAQAADPAPALLVAAEAVEALTDATNDAQSALNYILENHGLLSGVGFARCATKTAIAYAALDRLAEKLGGARND